MGALHKAHLELIRVARERAGPNGEVAVSIFVNPLQFEPGSDYERYPRPEKADEEFCRNAGVGLLFRPLRDEVYATDRSTFVEEPSLSSTLEGKSRPGHFRGVCTVVAKLFNILAPDAAVFGEKDFQHLAIIFFFQAEDGIRDYKVTGVQTCALPISIADLVGDSFELAVKSREIQSRLVVFCGVRFMAEGCATLAPERPVYLPSLQEIGRAAGRERV